MFGQVTIIGLGLLGGSLARDLRFYNLADKIVGVARSQSTAEFALANQVVDTIESLDVAVRDADLVVLATPMQTMLPILQQLEPHCSKDTLLTDVGSVKTHLYQALQAHCPALLPRFVLAHPIAGGESSGVTASRQGLFSEKHLIVTPTDEVDHAAIEKVEALWQAVNAKTVQMSIEMHDAVFAKTSHLPHVVAFSLVNYLSAQSNREQLFDLAAAGFYDFTRIASSDAVMWRDICSTNRQQVVASLDGFIAQVQKIRDNIEQDDQTAVLDYFDAAKDARDAGLVKKQSSSAR